MTQFATARDFMKLWTQSDATSKLLLQKLLLKTLDRSVQADSGILPLFTKGQSIDNPVVTWLEEKGYPTAITGQLATTTITISGTLFGATVTADAIYQVIRVGTILERESDGVQARVSSITGVSDGAPFTITVAAWGNSSLSDDTGPVTWRIISELWTDFKDADSTRSLNRVPRQVGTQIHAETFEIPKTRENTAYEIVTNETEHQIVELINKMKRSLTYALLRIRPYYNSGYKYGDAAEETAMCSLAAWPIITQAEAANPLVYVNLANAELTKTHIDTLARNMFLTEHADFNSGDWWIICHPLIHEYMADYDISFRRTDKKTDHVGFAVNYIDTKIGKTFPIKADQYMRPDMVQIVNFAEMSYGYYKADQLDRKELATQGRYRRWLISYQTYGVVARRPRQNIGTIYGAYTG